MGKGSFQFTPALAAHVTRSAKKRTEKYGKREAPPAIKPAKRMRIKKKAAYQ